MEWFLKVVRDNYINFSGRARRKEYWMFILFYVLIGMVISLLDSVLFPSSDLGDGPLNSIYSLALFLPSLAVGVRRLHDVGKSGWWMLLIFVIIIGWIVLLVWFVQDSQEGENEWGPDPKAGEIGH